MAITNNLDQLVIARRLIMDSQRAQDRRKGKPVADLTLKQEMEQDQAFISGDQPAAVSNTAPSQPQTSDAQTRLSDLIARLNALNKQQVDPAAAQPQAGLAGGQGQVVVQQSVEIQASLSYTDLPKVDGLVRLSQTQAETDRYSFDFSNGQTFKITDKWSGRSTTIWGDPHVDVDDAEGVYNGEFKDLKTSNSQTTLMLQDGTRVTFTAPDDNLIQSVDIYKGNQHLGGTGEGSAKWDPANGLFASGVDHTGAQPQVPVGDTVYAGGDGNDWFTAGGQLVWGKTTGPIVTQRPPAVLQFQYSETTSQQVSTRVNQQA